MDSHSRVVVQGTSVMNADVPCNMAINYIML